MLADPPAVRIHFSRVAGGAFAELCVFSLLRLCQAAPSWGVKFAAAGQSAVVPNFPLQCIHCFTRPNAR